MRLREVINQMYAAAERAVKKMTDNNLHIDDVEDNTDLDEDRGLYFIVPFPADHINLLKANLGTPTRAIDRGDCDVFNWEWTDGEFTVLVVAASHKQDVELFVS